MVKVLYEEKLVRRRFYSTLLLPLSFLLLLTVFLELSARLECDDQDQCVLVRTTVFTQRRTSEFKRYDISGLECIGSSYAPEKASGKCHLGFALRGSPDVLPFFHFENSSKAIFAAEELSNVFSKSVSRSNKVKEDGNYAISFHGSFIGSYAEGMSLGRRLLCLGAAFAVIILTVSVIVPHKREWRLSRDGMLAGYDCYLHSELVWRGSFWTLDKYRVSIESREVRRNGLVYGIYWLSLSLGGTQSMLGDVVRNDVDLLEPLTVLQNEMQRVAEAAGKKEVMEKSPVNQSLEGDTDNNNDNGKRNQKPASRSAEATLKKRRVAT